MSTSARFRQALSVVVAACGTAAAPAQTVTYLMPDACSIEGGKQVAVHVDIDDAGVLKRSAWPTQKIDWLFVLAPGTQENREDVGPANPAGDFINVALTRPGVTLVGMDTGPAPANVTGEQFKQFSKRAATGRAFADAIALIGDGDQVRIRRIESAKTLIRVRAPGAPLAARRLSHSPIAQSKSGQTVEIRALTDPTAVIVGSDLPVRAYVFGSKRVGAKVRATSVAAGQTQEAVTDSSGSCHFRIDALGIWRIEFHDLKPLEDDPEVDWMVYSATLTFEVTRATTGGRRNSTPAGGRE